MMLTRAWRVGWGLALLLATTAVAEGAQPADVRRDLGADERCGGHTLERHVAWTDAQLADRLRRQPGISAASTYTDRETAERVVGLVIGRERGRIAGWSRGAGRRPNLALRWRGDPRGPPIGRSLRRGSRSPDPCVDAVVVLRWDERRRTFCVLTSYPEVRR